MPTNHTPPPNQREASNGILIVDGYGISLTVHQGHLTVEDGVGSKRRSRRYPRVNNGLRRVVLLGTTGYVSLEAIRWLDDLNIPLIHLAADGRPLATTTHTTVDNAKLRRAQAYTDTNGTGITIARDLLSRKIAGQAVVAERLGHPALLRRHQHELDDATTTLGLMTVEADAARLYWDIWSKVPVLFTPGDQPRVPAHWLTVGPRSSPLTTQAARHAATPAHSILNYTYSLIEAEATVSCHAVGLDPGLGVLHSDKNGRQSLVHDLIEPIRPLADAHLLSMLRAGPFERSDFVETRGGACRLHRRLTHHLATTSDTWAKHLGPLTEHVAKAIANGHHTHVGSVPSPLTRQDRTRKTLSQVDARDAAYYRDTVYPVIRVVPAARIAEATGLSIHYAVKIRSGKHMPHRRHWEALRRAAAAPRS